MVSLPLLKRVGSLGELSLGVLITITLGSGIVSFAIVALLTTWITKARQKRALTRVRAIPDELPKTRRLSRPVLITEFAMSGPSRRFSSRFSLTPRENIPLPPPPLYNSFDFVRTPKQRPTERKSWLSGDNFHGATAENYAQESWFGSGWARQVHTMPSLSGAEKGGDEIYDVRRQNGQHRVSSYQEYRTERQPQGEYHEEKSQVQNHQSHSQQQQQLQHPNQDTDCIRYQMQGSGSIEGGIMSWGQKWRAPDTCCQLQPGQHNGPYVPYNKALSQLRRQGVRKPRTKRRTNEGNVNEERGKAPLTKYEKTRNVHA